MEQEKARKGTKLALAGEKEHALVKRAQQGDIHAFAQLYESCYRDLYRTALYNLGQEEDAKDVVSDTVLAAFENIGKLRSSEAFRSWIFQILLNQCRKRRKQYMQKTEELTEELKERLPGTQTDPCESMDVRRAFLALQEEDRMIVSLSVLGGYSSGEIAALLHRNASTVRSRLSRSMRRMQVLLEG